MVGLALITILIAGISIAGLWEINAIARQSNFQDQANLCLNLMREAYEQSVMEKSEGAGNQAATDWKKAKDKFLSEVKKLAQTPSLSEKEKRIIQSIENSWAGYDVSFQKYILARNGLAKSSLRQSVQKTRLLLEILIALAAVLGGVTIGAVLREISHQIDTIPSHKTCDNLADPEDQIKDEIRNLASLLNESNPMRQEAIENKDPPSND